MASAAKSRAMAVSTRSALLALARSSCSARLGPCPAMMTGVSFSRWRTLSRHGLIDQARRGRAVVNRAAECLGPSGFHPLRKCRQRKTPDHVEWTGADFLKLAGQSVPTYALSSSYVVFCLSVNFHMNLRRRNAVTSSRERSNHSPFLRLLAKRRCQ